MSDGDAPMTADAYFADIDGCVAHLIDAAERYAPVAKHARVVGAIPIPRHTAVFDLVVGVIGLCRAKRPYHNRLCTAYHEAGHAVMAMLVGADVARITMPGQGYFWVGAMLHKNRIRSTLHRILLNLAGAAGSALVVDETSLHPLTGATGDVEHCLNANPNLFFMSYKDQVSTLLKIYMPVAREIIDENRDAVSTLAEALVDRRWMCGYEAEEIVRPLLRPRDLGIDVEMQIEDALIAHVNTIRSHSDIKVIIRAFKIMDTWRMREPTKLGI